MLEKIKLAIEKLEVLSAEKPFKVISHFDTDGITSAAIFSRALSRWGKKFSLEIVKSLDEEFIRHLPEDHVLIFLDLASGSFNYLEKKNTEIFVFDHHEVISEVPKNVFMINPTLEDYEELSASAVCYLFAKDLSSTNLDLATLAVIGMIGDSQEKEIGRKFGEILQDSDTTVRKGLLIYPSTRPLDRALEFSSSPYIPNVTGSRIGVLDLLREAGIFCENGKFKALYELTDEEMKSLITAVMLRSGIEAACDKLLGNLFLVKFFNKLEDARELSALINACSRMGRPEIALGFCLGNKELKEEAEKIYIGYKQALVSALRHVSESTNIHAGNNYLIINARDNIKDTIIGTVASIISHSPLYPKGLIVVALAYSEDKIKVSARLAGGKGRDVRELLYRVAVPIGGEVGGHSNAAGAFISKKVEEQFIGELKRTLEVELVKI